MASETEKIVLDLDTVIRGVKAVFDDPSKGRYYVVEIDERPVACMLTTYEWSDWRNGYFLWIQSVWVEPEWRGKGVYKAMYHFLKELVLQHDIFLGLRLYVFHQNKAAQQVYHHLGMETDMFRMFEWIRPLSK